MNKYGDVRKFEKKEKENTIRSVILFTIGLILIAFGFISLKNDDLKLLVYIPIILGVLCIVISFITNFINSQDLYIETVDSYQKKLLAEDFISVKSKTRQEIKKSNLHSSIKSLSMFPFSRSSIFTSEEIKYKNDFINKYLLETQVYNSEDEFISFKGFLINFKIEDVLKLSLKISTYSVASTSEEELKFSDYIITYNKLLYKKEDITKEKIKPLVDFYKNLDKIFYSVINKKMNNGLKIDNGLVTIFISYDYNTHGISSLDKVKGYSLYREVVLAITKAYDFSLLLNEKYTLK